MLSPRARIAPLATVLALLLALTLIGPASAGTTVKRMKGAEAYAHQLLNCTRTGGWVQNDGTCIDRRSGEHSAFRKPLRLHQGLSKKVAWPWARALVKHEVCGHVIAGKPVLSKRFSNRGFRGSSIGENVGCAWGIGSAKDVVLRVHLAFQREKAASGGHWLNMKNERFKSVGIGVARRNGRTTVVYDFYGKRY